METKGNEGMKKVILYGIGRYYEAHKHLLPQDIEVMAYGDSNEWKATSRTGRSLEGKPVLLPEEIEREDFDFLFICTDFGAGNEIFFHLRKFDIPGSRIRFLNRIHCVKEGWEYIVQKDKSILSTIGKVRIRERERTDFDVVTEGLCSG